MDLSIIIVNYNVKYFLEQCLCAVEKAVAGVDAEIIVVDNNSTDGSIEYLHPRFPEVHFIASNQNLGFGKANNHALKIATGNYLLFLNPDTIVPENCFEKCIAFFELNKQCGALGVKMIDGNGNFLPESKRSFPSPLTSFYKLSGLSTLFPKSKIFNRYALGFLDENSNHEVDVLCGAFMMLTKEVASKTEGFDEAFFMYAEDIDLSYRIQQLGFKNCYFAESTIIHFKGESAAQQSLQHNKVFYEAMLVFVKKHYARGKAKLFLLFLQLAIAIRSLIGFIGKVFSSSSSLVHYKQIKDFILFGGIDETAEAKKLLKEAPAAIIVTNELALQQLQHLRNKAIVFCEGQGLSNEMIIQIVHQQKDKNSFWFHGKNTKAIVGSHSKTAIGHIIN